MKSCLLLNIKTNKIKTCNSLKDAAKYLNRDLSTVSRAVSGDRNILSVANHIITFI